MTKYFNIKGNYGTETIDEISQKDFQNYSEFRKECRRLANEYRLSGMNAYISQRCTKDWKNK